jgi:hypothetical protein
MHRKTRMLFQPLPHFFAVMGWDVVQHKMNQRNIGWNTYIEIFKKFYELLLPLAIESTSVDLAATGVECGKQLQCSATFVLMLNESWFIAEHCRLGRM